MRKFEHEYLMLLKEIATFGKMNAENKNGMTFNYHLGSLKINLLVDKFPILSCRKINFQQALVNMLGNVKGIKNAQWYHENGSHTWEGIGLENDVFKQVRKQDHELADDYCSEKGKWKSHDLEYRNRYRALNTLSYEDGLTLIEKDDIPLFKDVLLKEKGELGPIPGYLWRFWGRKEYESIDQLRHAFNQLKTNPSGQNAFINNWDPALIPPSGNTPRDNILNDYPAVSSSHVSHAYLTVPIDLITRVGIYNQRVATKYIVSLTDPNIETKLKAAKIPQYYLNLSCVEHHWDFINQAPEDICGYAIMLNMMANLQNMIPLEISINATDIYIPSTDINKTITILNHLDNDTIPICSPKLRVDLRPEITFIDQFELTDFILEDYTYLDPIKNNAV